MKKQDVLNEISLNAALLAGTTRPASNVQIDRWILDSGDVVMVTSREQWNSYITKPTHFAHTYNNNLIIRIEQLTELTK
jgi:hypothetical protein